MGRLKTFFLMAILFLVFMAAGNFIGGADGMRIAFYAALGVNFFSYFFSDKLVLSQYKAKSVDAKTNPRLYNIVQSLAQRAGLPMPKVYIIPDQIPNAFATGRNPRHAAVAVTEGLLKILDDEEIEGVLAHEMSHIKHYDILTGSIAAVFAGAIAKLAYLFRGTSNSENNRRRSAFGTIIGTFLLPIAAVVIQMAISRTREYAADRGAALLTGHPEWLMSALQKLENYAHGNILKNATSQSAHLFIVNPFAGLPRSLSSLFSTHPSTEDRIRKLAAMR